MITLYSYRRPYHLGVREGFILKIDFPEGKIGWGEIAPLPGYSQESREVAEKELYELLPRISDEIDLSPYSPSVQFGVSSALSARNEAPGIDPVPINALVHLDELEHFDSSPYNTIKIKIGNFTPKEAIRLMEKGKDQLASKKLRIDVNRAWSLADTSLFAESCSWMNLEYFEDPVELDAFPYPTALDEHFRKGAISCTHLKALIYKPSLQVWDKTQVKKGVDFIFSSSYETELGLMQIAKLAFRKGLPIKPMGLDTYRLFKEPLFEEKLKVKEGKLIFPSSWTLIEGKVNAVFRVPF